MAGYAIVVYDEAGDVVFRGHLPHRHADEEGHHRHGWADGGNGHEHGGPGRPPLALSSPLPAPPSLLFLPTPLGSGYRANHTLAVILRIGATNKTRN